MTFSDKLRSAIKTAKEEAGRAGLPWNEAAWGGVVDKCFAEATKERKKAAVLPAAEQVYALYPRKVGRVIHFGSPSRALSSANIRSLKASTSALPPSKAGLGRLTSVVTRRGRTTWEWEAKGVSESSGIIAWPPLRRAWNRPKDKRISHMPNVK